MKTTNDSLFVTADTISKDLNVSRPMAYKIIKSLNSQLKEAHPNAIVIAGRVNRMWYYDALLLGMCSDEVRHLSVQASNDQLPEGKDAK